LGDGAEIRSPLAIVVIAGLVTSTVLTLVIMPTIYAATETAVATLRAKKLAGGGPAGAEPVRGS
jgi:HAE1 family hydrophobic/amphiphilic exporter-1